MCTYIASCTHFYSQNLDFESLLAPFLAPFWHLFRLSFAIWFQYRFLNVFFLDFGRSWGALGGPRSVLDLVYIFDMAMEVDMD